MPRQEGEGVRRLAAGETGSEPPPLPQQSYQIAAVGDLLLVPRASAPPLVGAVEGVGDNPRAVTHTLLKRCPDRSRLRPLRRAAGSPISRLRGPRRTWSGVLIAGPPSLIVVDLDRISHELPFSLRQFFEPDLRRRLVTAS